MKRIVVTIAILVIVSLGFVASLPLFLSSDTVRERILTGLGELTGREVSFQGSPSVAFSPFLGIEISNLVIADPNALESGKPLLMAETVQAQLDLLPALLGEISVSQYRLVRPRLNLKTYLDGFSNWEFGQGEIRKAVETAAEGSETPEVTAKLGTFIFEDGAVHYEDEISGATEEATNINATLRWQDTASPVWLAGSGIWRSENVSVDLSVAKLIDLVSGGESNLSIEFGSTPLNTSFDGKANMIADLFLDGDLKASSPSIERLSGFLRLNTGDFSVPGEWGIEGKMEGTGSSAKINDAKVSIAGHQGSGAVSLAIDELKKAKLDGTIAFEQLVLPSMPAELPAPSSGTTDLVDVQDIEIDFRVSAGSLLVGEVEFSNLAAAINTNEGKWALDIGYSEVFEGTVTATISELAQDGKEQFILELTARDVDAESISDLFESRLLTITGKADIDASLRTQTLSSGLNADGFNGSVSAQVTAGTIEGINIHSMLKQDPNSPRVKSLKSLDDPGSTPFESASFTAFLNSGVASIAKAEIKSGEQRVQMIGDVSFVDNGIALRAQHMTDKGPLPESLFIGGTLNNPLFSFHASRRKGNTETNQPEAPANVIEDAPDVSN